MAETEALLVENIQKGVWRRESTVNLGKTKVMKFEWPCEDCRKASVQIVLSAINAVSGFMEDVVVYLVNCRMRLIKKFFFSNRVINIWNSLPDNIVAAISIARFKRSLNEFDFSHFLHQQFKDAHLY